MGAPQITGLVIRQHGTNLYWSQNSKWDERLSEAVRWTNYRDMITCAQVNQWPPSEQVWLGWKDRVIEVRRLHLV